MQRRVSTFVGVVSVALLATVVRTEPVRGGDEPVGDMAVAAVRQSFVGEWKLNKELSDDPRAKMREGRAGGGRPSGPGGGGWGGEPPTGGPGGGGWGGGRRGGGPGGGWGGGGRRGEGTARQRADGTGGPAAGMLFAADRITITNLTPEITIVAPDGGLRTLHADGRGYRTSSGGTVKTRWDGARLLVETKGARGRLKEAWTLSAEPRRLTVLLEIERPFSGKAMIKRIFDPLRTEAPKAAPPGASPPETPR